MAGDESNKIRVSALLTRYLKELEKNPMRTKMITAGSLSGAQELLASYLAGARNKNGGYFTPRVYKMMCFGGFVSAPLGHFLFWALQKTFPGTTLWDKILQLVASNIFVTPVQNVVALSAMAIIAGATTFDQVKAAVKASFWGVTKMVWLTSPVVMGFAQKFLPPQLWVPYFNLVGFVVGTFINTSAKKQRLAALRKEAEGAAQNGDSVGPRAPEPSY